MMRSMPEAFFRAEGGVHVLEAEHSWVTHVTQMADVVLIRLIP